MEYKARRILTIIANKRIENICKRNIMPEYCILDSASLATLKRKDNGIYIRACEDIDMKARVYGLTVCVVDGYEGKEIIEVR